MMPTARPHRLRLLQIALYTGLGVATISPRPVGATPRAAVEARAASWTGSYLKGVDAVKDLAAQGAPAMALSVLRSHADATEPRLRALAKALLYRHAGRLHLDAAERDRLHAELVLIAEDRSAPGFAREEACATLLGLDVAGREALYLKWIADASLRDLHDGVMRYSPLLAMLRDDPERWVPRLLPLLAQPGDVRSNVAHLLAQLCDSDGRPPRRDIAVALLPWLADAQWAAGVPYRPSPRSHYVSSLQQIDLKDAVPGLIHIVETEHDYMGARAASVLAKYRDPRALPALQASLSHHLGVDWEREAFASAITACGGLQPAAGVSALEAYARLASTPDGLERIRASRLDPGASGVSQAMGIHLARAETAEDALVTALIQRLDALRGTEPNVALAMEAPLFAWDSRAARCHVAARLGSSGLDDALLRRALAARGQVVKHCAEPLRTLAQGGGSAAGYAVAVLEDRALIHRVLGGRDAAAILALLHAATVSDANTNVAGADWGILFQAQEGQAVLLPTARVGPLLQSADATVATAARAFLKREGGPSAQAWLTAGRAPSEAARKAYHFNIAGIVPGMTRTQAAGAGSQNIAVAYADNHQVVRVSGNVLRDGARPILSEHSTAADVRRLLGRPDSEGAGHIYGVVGGMFWHYERDGQHVEFIFRSSDDRLASPLVKIVLHAPAAPAPSR